MQISLQDEDLSNPYDFVEKNIVRPAEIILKSGVDEEAPSTEPEWVLPLK